MNLLRICGAALVAGTVLIIWYFMGAASRDTGTSDTHAAVSRAVTDIAGAASHGIVPPVHIAETPVVVRGELDDWHDVGITRFAGVEGYVVSVTVRSDAFGPRVMLVSTDGDVLAEKHQRWSDEVRLAAILPGTGDYVVEVTAVDYETGPYELAVDALRQVEELAFDAPVDGYLAGEADAEGWRFTANPVHRHGSSGELRSLVANPRFN